MELLDALAFLDETCKAYTNQNLENNNKALKCEATKKELIFGC